MPIPARRTKYFGRRVQIPNNNQITNVKLQTVWIWNLLFGIYLVFGVWDLEF